MAFSVIYFVNILFTHTFAQFLFYLSFGKIEGQDHLLPTWCSEKMCFFKNSTSLSLGCYWLYKKWPANRNDCIFSLLWLLWKSLAAICRRGIGCRGLWKKYIFSWTPCRLAHCFYYLFCFFSYWSISVTDPSHPHNAHLRHDSHLQFFKTCFVFFFFCLTH